MKRLSPSLYLCHHSVPPQNIHSEHSVVDFPLWCYKLHLSVLHVKTAPYHDVMEIFTLFIPLAAPISLMSWKKPCLCSWLLRYLQFHDLKSDNVLNNFM